MKKVISAVAIALFMLSLSGCCPHGPGGGPGQGNTQSK
jgi:predicted small lipoprotein YifL